jgi:peptide/nickel transport system substrate-binding protein
MLNETRLTRGSALKLSAMTAIGTAMSAAGGMVAATVATAQKKYGEAPSLAAQVASGALPSVDKRLPENPYTVPHKWLAVGKYGGTLQMGCDNNEWGTAGFMHELQYGHSPLRYLRDGLEIGPGLAEKWEQNADASEWVLYFRKGLRWSDGQPWTVADVLFWWEDQVKVEELKEYPPDEARSGKGTLMTMTKIDDYTIKMSFDAPAPLTADRLAMWVNRGIGPRWMDPKHYLEQYHIKYNAALDKDKWIDTFTQMRDFARNPGCPTMTGWVLEAFEKAQFTKWVRNPYYWCVDKEGNQLPYIDRIEHMNYQDTEVFKLRITGGQLDYVHGGWTGLALADVQTFRAAEARSGMELRLWDGGSGTSSMYFFNWDLADPKMRALIRTPKFRKALSHAFNRSAVRKAVYFDTGELTSGTMSPKALEYNVPGGKSVYEEWRDSAIKYDPAGAKALLAEIGLKDTNGDGFLEMADGTPIEVTLDFSANENPTGEHVRKSEFLAKDWNAVGIKTTLNPIPQTSIQDLWRTGKRMTNVAWEVGDGPNHLVYPQWVVPMEDSRWAPLAGNWYLVRGTTREGAEADKDPYERTPPRAAPEAGSPIARLWELYDQTKIEPDVNKRNKLVWDMIKIHVQDGPFYSGVAANTPRIVLVKKGLSNVPKRDDLALGGFTNPWIHPTPAVYDPEAYFFDDPSAR